MDFVLACIYTFIIFTRPQNWVPWLRDVALVDWLVVPSVAVIAIRQMSGKGQRLFSQPQVILVLLFWFLVIFTFVTKTFALEISLSFQFMARNVVPFLLVAVAVNSRRRFDAFCLLLLACLLLMAYHCYLQSTTGHGLDGRGPLMDTTTGTLVKRVRAFGIFDGPNETSNLMALGAVMSLAFAWRYRGPVWLLMPVWLALAAFFGYALWNTGSRQAVFFPAAGLFALFVKLNGRREIIGAAAAALLLFLGIGFAPRWAGGVGQDRASRRRAATLTAGLRQFRRDPVFGVGRWRARDALGTKMPPHNSYLEILVENGFPGLAVYLGAFWVPGLQCLFIVRTRPENKVDRADMMRARTVLGILATTAASAYFQNRGYLIDIFIYWATASAFGAIMLAQRPDIVPAYFRARWLRSAWGLGLLVAAPCVMIVVIHLTAKFFWRTAG